MELGPATVRGLVEIAMLIQAREWRRIGHPFVESLDLLGGNGPRTLRLFDHFDLPSSHESVDSDIPGGFFSAGDVQSFFLPNRSSFEFTFRQLSLSRQLLLRPSLEPSPRPG